MARKWPLGKTRSAALGPFDAGIGVDKGLAQENKTGLRRLTRHTGPVEGFLAKCRCTLYIPFREFGKLYEKNASSRLKLKKNASSQINAPVYQGARMDDIASTGIPE